jgi:hypothetical protein
MRRVLSGIAIAGLVAGCGGGAPASVAPSPEAAPVEFFIPQRVASFTFNARKDDPNPALGTQVRFETTDTLLADVFIYPGPDFGDQCDRACATRLLAQETDGFVGSFGAMKAQGYVAEITVRESHPLAPGAGTRWMMGRHFVLDVTRDGRAQRSDYWLVYFAGTRLKVRATYPDTAPNVERVAAFLDEVAGAFTTRPIPRDALAMP